MNLPERDSHDRLLPKNDTPADWHAALHTYKGGNWSANLITVMGNRMLAFANALSENDMRNFAGVLTHIAMHGGDSLSPRIRAVETAVKILREGLETLVKLQVEAAKAASVIRIAEATSLTNPEIAETNARLDQLRIEVAKKQNGNGH